MQSVLPAVYPILKTAYRLDFGQIGLITFANQATASLLQPVIGNFTDRSPRPVFAADRYGLHAGRPAAALGRPDLRRDSPRGGDGGHRLVGVSPRVVACGAARVRRASRVRAVAVSGWRQHRVVHGPAPRRVHRRSRTVSAASPGLVWPRSQRWPSCCRSATGIAIVFSSW